MNYSLMGSGVLGLLVAIIHGLLMEKFLQQPISQAKTEASPVAMRLLRPLLQFSTYAWALGGCGLVYLSLDETGQLRSAGFVWFVAAMYLYGALFNLIGTRGKHPGGYLLLLCVALIYIAQ